MAGKDDFVGLNSHCTLDLEFEPAQVKGDQPQHLKANS